MRKILRNRPLMLTLVGLIILGQSALWEYVRVRPTYRFLIEPWSLRGYELPHGLVIAASAVAIGILTVLVARGIIKESLGHSAIAVGSMVAFGIVAAILADAKDVTTPFVLHAILAAIGGVAVMSLLERFIPEDWSRRRRAARFGMWLVATLVLLLAVIRPLLTDEKPFWLFVLVAGIIIGALALFRPPTQLATRRIIINAIAGVWLMSMTMSASLRQALMERQFELNQISADLGDLQITSGVIIAWFGGLVAIIGAVGMWARRRDQIIAHDRARKQQAAAAESEEQLSA